MQEKEPRFIVSDTNPRVGSIELTGYETLVRYLRKMGLEVTTTYMRNYLDYDHSAYLQGYVIHRVDEELFNPMRVIKGTNKR